MALEIKKSKGSSLKREIKVGTSPWWSKKIKTSADVSNKDGRFVKCLPRPEEAEIFNQRALIWLEQINHQGLDRVGQGFERQDGGQD